MAYGHSIEHRNGGTVHLEPAIDEWYGQTFAALGDSIVWAGAPMLNRMRSRLGFLSYRNLGVSGRPMADGTANGVGTVTTALANNFTTDSLVYIASGTNDFKLNVPLGEIGALGATSHSRSTFYGAYRTTIDHLLSQNPGVQIALATPLQRNNGGYSTTTTNTAGHMLRDYCAAIFALGEMYSLPVVDLYTLSGISEKTLDRYTSDGLHPNEQGYVQMARVVVGQLRSGGTSASAGHTHALGEVAGLSAALEEAKTPWERPSLLSAEDDLDTLPSGAYRVASSSVAVALGFPTTNSGELVIYKPYGTNGVVGRAIWLPTNVDQTWETRKHGGDWLPWRLTDWSDAIAELEYDTGWRTFTPVGAHLTGDGEILFRRIGDAVYCRFDKVGFSNTIGNFAYLNDPGFIPVGFRPEYAGRPMAVMSNVNANPSYIIGIAQGSRFRFQTSIPEGMSPGTGSQAVVGQMSWSTLEARPSLDALPGDPA